MGAQTTLTAVPNRGYRFTNWTDNEAGGAVVSTESVYTFVPTDDVNYIANFEALPEYTVSIVSADATMGSTNVSAFEDGKYFKGDEVVIEARPADGYLFSQWSDGNSEWKRVLTLNRDVELAAQFISLPEPSFIAKWSLSENTEAISIGSVSTSFGTEGCTELETTKSVRGVDFRLFQPILDDKECVLTFELSPTEENKEVVVNAVEFDAVRNAVYGNIRVEIMEGENGETFAAGRPEQNDVSHYYYNAIGENAATAVRIVFSGVSNGRQYGFANVRIQGRLRDAIATGILQAVVSDVKTSFFTLGGQRIDSQTRGLNIIRMSDGTVKKIVVK